MLAGFYWITLRLSAMGRNGFGGHYADRRNRISVVLRMILPPRMDHNPLPSRNRNMRLAPMERALRELSNEVLMRFWGVLRAEL